ncbi:hypothetical protein [Roseovarius litoreus]|nr:hypothetical protein [Roseovarius litoreus]
MAQLDGMGKARAARAGLEREKSVMGMNEKQSLNPFLGVQIEGGRNAWT